MMVMAGYGWLWLVMAGIVVLRTFSCLFLFLLGLVVVR